MNEDIIKQCVSEYDAPIYLYDKETIVNKFKILSDVIWEKSNIFYSMKANPALEICRLLIEQGSGIEVASAEEMRGAFKAGAKADDIIFTSPGKTKEELEYAISKNIRVINVESMFELQLINDIAKQKKLVTRVALRINPSATVSNAKIKMTGVSSQFGIEEEDIDDEFISQIKLMTNIEVIGIQVYMGTNILEYADIIKNTEYVINLAQIIEKKFNSHFSYINFGGGFGVPYFEGDKQLNMEQLKTHMQSLWDKYYTYLQDKYIVFESGRYIMSEAGSFITKVLYAKNSKGKKYLICNGGSNFHASSAFLGRFVRNNYPMYVLGKRDGLKEKVNVVGPLCTPTDIIGKDVMLAEDVALGDYIVIEMSGAYGLTYSPCLFLGHKMPLEILYDGEKFAILEN